MEEATVVVAVAPLVESVIWGKEEVGRAVEMEEVVAAVGLEREAVEAMGYEEARLAVAERGEGVMAQVGEATAAAAELAKEVAMKVGRKA